jgi:hypothetical protein
MAQPRPRTCRCRLLLGCLADGMCSSSDRRALSAGVRRQGSWSQAPRVLNVHRHVSIGERNSVAPSLPHPCTPSFGSPFRNLSSTLTSVKFRMRRACRASETDQASRGTWRETRTAAPLRSALDGRLQIAKFLYCARFGPATTRYAYATAAASISVDAPGVFVQPMVRTCHWLVTREALR